MLKMRERHASSRRYADVVEIRMVALATYACCRVDAPRAILRRVTRVVELRLEDSVELLLMMILFDSVACYGRRATTARRCYVIYAIAAELLARSTTFI